jgi:hypothetical protein
LQEVVQNARVERVVVGALRFGESGDVAVRRAFQERRGVRLDFPARFCRVEETRLFRVFRLMVEQAARGDDVSGLEFRSVVG